MALLRSAGQIGDGIAVIRFAERLRARDAVADRPRGPGQVRVWDKTPSPLSPA